MRYGSRQAYERAQLAALRSLLQSRPGPEAWAQVCDLAQAWRGEAFEQVERYIEDHIQRWPDAARVLPERWRRWIMRGDDVPQARLVRHLRVHDTHRPRAPQRMTRLRRMLECPHLSHISHLSIEGLCLDELAESVAHLKRFIARQPRPFEHVRLCIHVAPELDDATHGALSATWNDLLHSLPTRTLTTNLTKARLHTRILPETPLADHLETLTLLLLMPSCTRFDPKLLPQLRHITVGVLQSDGSPGRWGLTTRIVRP